MFAATSVQQERFPLFLRRVATGGLGQWLARDGWPVSASHAAPARGFGALLTHLLAFRFAHPLVYRFLRRRFSMTLPWGIDWTSTASVSLQGLTFGHQSLHFGFSHAGPAPQSWRGVPKTDRHARSRIGIVVPSNYVNENPSNASLHKPR